MMLSNRVMGEVVISEGIRLIHSFCRQTVLSRAYSIRRRALSGPWPAGGSGAGSSNPCRIGRAIGWRFASQVVGHHHGADRFAPNLDCQRIVFNNVAVDQGQSDSPDLTLVSLAGRQAFTGRHPHGHGGTAGHEPDLAPVLENTITGSGHTPVRPWPRVGSSGADPSCSE